MAQSVDPMQLLVSIVERGKGIRIIEYYKAHSLFHHIQASGRGTAASNLLDTLGFGTTERDVVLTFGQQDTVRQLMHHLRDEERSKLNIQGIAFSLCMSGMSAILAVCISRMEEVKAERGNHVMEQNSHHSLILVAVNQGYTDAVMDTARAAGAKGGTAIRARWTEADEVQKISGITLQAEKEVLAIMVNNEERNTIMEEIDRVHGLRSSAQGMIISLPIDCTARLD